MAHRRSSEGVPTARRQLTAQAWRYVVIGLSVGMVYVLISYAIASRTPLLPSTAAVISYMVTTPFAFGLHRGWTFRSAGRLWPQFLRFLIVSLALQMLGYLLDWWILGRVPLELQLLCLWGMSSVLNFLAYRFVVFEESDATSH